MKLVVTGGAGYVGGVCAAVLAERGHDVVVVDDLSTGNRDGVPPGVRFVEGNVADVIGHVLSEESYDGVLHFAAQSLVGESVEKPEKYWRGNLGAALELLDAVTETGVTRLVFSSTAATYGEPEISPITEDAPTRPTNPYGASKLAIDNAITGYAQAHGFGATSLRYFNVAGAHAGFGENRVVETHLIPLVLQVALGQREKISVFGTDWPTPDGTAVRDYIHVRDLAEAHLLALESSVPSTHRIFNLGSGHGFSVREVIASCERVTGLPIAVENAPRRAGDPAVLVASSEKAMAELGWKPASTGLDEIVGDAWEFLQQLGDRSHSARRASP